MQHARRSAGEARRVAPAVDAFAARLDADELDRRIVEEAAKQADGVAPTADAGDGDVGQRACLREDLRARFVADHVLEIGTIDGNGCGPSALPRR